MPQVPRHALYCSKRVSVLTLRNCVSQSGLLVPNVFRNTARSNFGAIDVALRIN
jgi:hypothetical protein